MRKCSLSLMAHDPKDFLVSPSIGIFLSINETTYSDTRQDGYQPPSPLRRSNPKSTQKSAVEEPFSSAHVGQIPGESRMGGFRRLWPSPRSGSGSPRGQKRRAVRN